MSNDQEVMEKLSWFLDRNISARFLNQKEKDSNENENSSLELLILYREALYSGYTRIDYVLYLPCYFCSVTAAQTNGCVPCDPRSM